MATESGAIHDIASLPGPATTDADAITLTSAQRLVIAAALGYYMPRAGREVRAMIASAMDAIL